MGFVMLGIATLTSFGLNAAVFGMVAHGLITGMLFFLAGSVKERYHTLEIRQMGGLLLRIPRFGWILGFCAMASLGLPGLAGFWGEFPAILSAYQPAAGVSEEVFRAYMVIAAIGTVLAAAYLLLALPARRVRRGERDLRPRARPRRDAARVDRMDAAARRHRGLRHLPEPDLRHDRRRRRQRASRRSEAEPVHLLAQADGWVQPNIDYHAARARDRPRGRHRGHPPRRPAPRRTSEVGDVVARRHRPARRVHPGPDARRRRRDPVDVRRRVRRRRLLARAQGVVLAERATRSCSSRRTTSTRATTTKASTTRCCSARSSAW